MSRSSRPADRRWRLLPRLRREACYISLADKHTGLGEQMPDHPFRVTHQCWINGQSRREVRAGDAMDGHFRSASRVRQEDLQKCAFMNYSWALIDLDTSCKPTHLALLDEHDQLTTFDVEAKVVVPASIMKRSFH